MNKHAVVGRHSREPVARPLAVAYQGDHVLFDAQQRRPILSVRTTNDQRKQSTRCGKSAKPQARSLSARCLTCSLPTSAGAVKDVRMKLRRNPINAVISRTAELASFVITPGTEKEEKPCSFGVAFRR